MDIISFTEDITLSLERDEERFTVAVVSACNFNVVPAITSVIVFEDLEIATLFTCNEASLDNWLKALLLVLVVGVALVSHLEFPQQLIESHWKVQ